MTYLFNRTSYKTLDELNSDKSFRKLKTPVMATGPGLPDGKLVYVFKNEASFYRWTKDTSRADDFAGLKKKVNQARRQRLKIQDDTKKRQQAYVRRIARDLRSLSKRAGLKTGSAELILKASINRDVLEPSIFDPAILFTGLNFSGSFLGVGVPLPNLAWFAGFNNTVSSLTAVGICAVWTGSWFRGPSRFFVGAPFVGINNLGLFGLNNNISSVVAYLY